MPRMDLFRLIVGAMFAALLFVAPVMAAEADLAALVADQPAAPLPPQQAAPAPARTGPATRGRQGPALAVPNDRRRRRRRDHALRLPGQPGQRRVSLGQAGDRADLHQRPAEGLEAVTASETLFARVELSFGADRLGLGTLPADIAANNLNISETSVWLENFNIRTLLWKENDCLFGIKAPAITFGVSLKYNSDISNINKELGNALSSIGYRRDEGVDFTLTATKTFPHLLLDRPLIITTGLRLSEAADIGFLGFGDTYRATFEGNIAWLPWDKVLVAYEFRQNADPYGKIPNAAIPGQYLIGAENNWNAFDLALIVNKHSTLVAGWALLGNLANTSANNSWFLQYKYEF